MFIRTKKISGADYAYLVSNEWRGKGSRQKVSKYLGRVVKMQKQHDNQPVLQGSFQEALVSLLSHTLSQHGFAQQESKHVLGNHVCDLNQKTCTSNNNRAVFAMHEGFLCDHTLQNLLSFQAIGSASEIGGRLATALVDAGVKLAPELFVQLVDLAAPEPHTFQGLQESLG